MFMNKDPRLFQRTASLEREIELFLDYISKAALIYRMAVSLYLENAGCAEFREKLMDVNQMESDADKLRRSIEEQLYIHTLIPDNRGDVLGLIENLDRVLNLFEASLWAFEIEAPKFPERFHADINRLTEASVKAVEHLVIASRAFFRDFKRVGDHNHKVMFFEKEADKISTKLKREIFLSDATLGEKIHMRQFIEEIDMTADWAEDVADRLAIYAIKRSD